MNFKYEHERKKQIISEIQYYMETEFDLSIGELGAENILFIMTDLLGPTLYNKGIHDARMLVNDNMQTIEDSLYALEKK